MTKALLFDFDGTIADTVEGILLTMRETFKAMGRPVPSDDAIRHAIGLPLGEMIKGLGDLDDESADKGADKYRELFPVFELTHITMFPGVCETIRELAARGVRMAICTSRGFNSLKNILSRYDLWECFETAVTASDGLPSKPAPDMVLTLLARMGLSADETIVVGDTTFDIQMGNSAGCRTVAVTYGNHSLDLLRTVSPTYIIDKFSDILQLI